MKKFSIRKIVLSSIGLFASLMLLIGLAFNVIAYDMGLGGSAGDAVSDALQTEANGFTLLSFALPKFLRTSILTYVNKDFCSLFETLLGITSLLSLLLSIAGMALIVLGFFRFEGKKNTKTITLLLTFGVIVALVHGVLGIVFASSVQAEMEKTFEDLSETLGGAQSALGDYTTSAFISVIFQAVCLVGFIVCSKKIKETQSAVATKEKSAETPVATKITQNKEENVDKEGALKKLIATEKEIVKILLEYKALYDMQIISTADYIDKKVKLLRYAEKRVKSGAGALLGKCSFEGVVNAESEVVLVLKEYAQLLKDEVISNAEFIEKKVALLSYVIN